MLWGHLEAWRRKQPLWVPWACGGGGRLWRGWALGVFLACGVLDSLLGCLVLLKRKPDVGVTQDSGRGDRACG